uniref:glycogen debranching protein GlgX n=1 Tax=Vaginimicrobium propionicum TaxID=1871034 RepID=UPI000970DC3C|nr:glycogen debranching protein GlgX [Vaginimicrobium propionicum]
MEAKVDQLTLTQAAPLLGANLSDDGCMFGLWAPRATRVELALFNQDETQHNIEMVPKLGVWQVFVPGIRATQRYGFRVHGQWAPDKGLRANPAKLLVDPRAKAITAGVDYSGSILDHTAESNYLPDFHDSAGAVPLSVVVEPTAPPKPIARRRSMSDSLIYELHVRGFTRQHPDVPEHLRGTYAGLAYPAVIDYLKSIGVTAVELMPVQHFVSEPLLIRRGLHNYWGYNTLGFFAPHAAYCSVGTVGQQVTEFKKMVTKLHEADIEVILDVVYNHTGEGGHEGPTLSYRGIDHAGYYRLSQDLRNDYDVTGCGNSFDTSHADVLGLVIESLRYWVCEMGVDGFRFDLATELIRDANHRVDHNHEFKKILETDPTFKDIKLIAEPWDVGPFGYQVGNWGPKWSEWNDRYRGFIRDYWRGHVRGVQELATRLAGSADIFNTTTRKSSSSINFVTAHDGFTLRDLVTYNEKHNELNGEFNRDGSNDNRSWNCGVEGETDDVEINRLRHRQVRNMLATLILSKGVPMVTAGDEIGRTQQGNNNAYCQDTPISWLSWEEASQWQDVTELMAKLTLLRQESPLLREEEFVPYEPVTNADGDELDRIRLSWMNGRDGELNQSDWHDPARQLLGMYLSDASHALLIWFYAGAEPINVTLPPKNWGQHFEIRAHTGENDEFEKTSFTPGESFTMPGRSVVYMNVTVST